MDKGILKLIFITLTKVKVWMDCNKLALNTEKTNVVLFHSPNRKSKDLIPLKFGKESIKRAKYVKFFGVQVDEHLSWKHHICELHKKLSRRTGHFFKLRCCLPLATLIRLYKSLFSSFLNYGMIVWGLLFDTIYSSISSTKENCLMHKFSIAYSHVYTLISFIKDSQA